MAPAERFHQQARLESIGDRVVLFQRHTDRPKNLPTRRRLQDRLAELGVKIETRPQVAVASGSSEGHSLKLEDIEHSPGASSSAGIWTRNISTTEEVTQGTATDARANAMGEPQRSRQQAQRRSCSGCDCSGIGCCYCNSASTEETEVVEVAGAEVVEADSSRAQDWAQRVMRRGQPLGEETPKDLKRTSAEGMEDWTYTAGELPHERRLLLSSSGARQFEFHPTCPNTCLVGRKDGVVAVLDLEADKTTRLAAVDHFPILGLSWLHTNPQWAVCGVSQSGTTCLVHYNESESSTAGEMEHVRLEPFHHLSSLSVNCTDEYFITSGFCTELGLYDIVTGRRINTFRRMHQNFINIARFAHRSPHIFATASFDHSCKLWDLRQNLENAQPIQTFKTDTLNVMCTFSPDDQNLLCSGIDATLQQFNIQKHGDGSGSRFPLPAMQSSTNYRRSLYLKGGDLVATVATNESLLRICLAASPHQQVGHIDFKGSLRAQKTSCQAGNAVEGTASAPATPGTVPGTGLPRSGVQGLLRSWTRGLNGTRAGGGQVQSRVPPSNMQYGDEYIQSLRSHPTDPMLLGALLSTSDMNHPESYITMLRLGTQKDGSR